MKKRILAFLLTFVMTVSLLPLTVSAATSRSYSKDGNVFLGNDKIELGINEYGSFGTTAKAPSNFHPWSGASQYIGLVSAPWGSYRDYFLPGTVDEGFLFYWNGSEKAHVRSNSLGNVTKSHYTLVSDGTVDKSSGNTLMAETEALVNNSLEYGQQISFKADEGFATVKLVLKNVTSSTLSGVEYIRGFDPDQGSDYSTSNYYHIDSDGTVWVVATPTSKTGTFTSVEAFASGIKAPFIFAAPKSNDYTVVPVYQGVGWDSRSDFTDVTASSSAFRLNYSAHDDKGIGLKFKCGDIAPGEAVTITYFMSLDTDVSSAFDAIKGAVSGSGIDSSTGQVALDLSKKAESIIVKVDGRTLVEGEDYTVSGADTLNPIITFKPTAGLTSRSDISVEVVFADDAGSDTIDIPNNIPSNFNITVNSASNGSVTANKSDAAVDESVTVTVAPNEGYKLDKLIVDGVNVTNDVLGGKYTFDMPANDVTVSATFKRITYTVTFVDYDDAELDKQTVNHGDSAIAPDDPEREGYTFTGWNKAFNNITGILTVKAQYTINSYTINFADTGDSVIAPITQNYGTAVTAPADPTREGYNFIGWDEEIPSNMPAKNVTVTAIWQEKDDVILDDADQSYVYDGTAQEFDIIGNVTDNFSVKYMQNGREVTPVNAGTYDVVITRLEDYDYKKFSDIYTLVIEKKDIADATITLGTALTYNGKEQTQTIASVVVDGLTVTYDVSGNKATNAGDYTLTVAGNGNFKGTATKAWTIEKKDIADATITLGTALTYNGKEQTQTIASVVVDGLTVTYDVSGNKATNAGDYTLTVAGNGNFKGTATKAWTIAKATPTIKKYPEFNKVRQYDKLNSSKFTGGAMNGVDGTISGKFSWKNPETKMNRVGAFAQMVVFTPTDSINYNSVEFKLIVDVYSGVGQILDLLQKDRYKTVEFNSNGGSEIEEQRVKLGDPAVMPMAPTKDGFEFGGWYIDSELTTEYDFEASVDENIVLYAKWTQNESEQGEGGSCPSLAFTDLDVTEWYHVDTDYVLSTGLMNGMGDNIFAPDGDLTRAMLVTVLWRLEGMPVANYAMTFEDVESGTWYCEAVRWAAAEGIVNGYSAEVFGPNDPITREQVMAILNRYASYKNYESPEISVTDIEYVYSDWSKENILWATSVGITENIGVDISDMTVSATRVEIAAYLRRFCDVIPFEKSV